ncbi:TPA: hypothetical protein MM158_005145 [Klebsiella pneumoniae]|nr:hypothetical protein [Klebsiella pneumoniae]
MKKIFFLMAFVLFLGVAVWASTSYDIKSALNISAGLTAVGITFSVISYVIGTVLFCLFALIIAWMQESYTVRFFGGALYFSLVNYGIIFFMDKYVPDAMFLGFHASNVVGGIFSIMVTILLLIGMFLGLTHRKYS